MDKVKNKLEQKDKELKELIKEISKYDPDFNNQMSSFLENQSSSVLQNESVINDLSFINPNQNNNNKSMLIEKGAIGDGNKAAENGESAGYF